MCGLPSVPWVPGRVVRTAFQPAIQCPWVAPFSYHSRPSAPKSGKDSQEELCTSRAASSCGDSVTAVRAAEGSAQELPVPTPAPQYNSFSCSFSVTSPCYQKASLAFRVNGGGPVSYCRGVRVRGGGLFMFPLTQNWHHREGPSEEGCALRNSHYRRVPRGVLGTDHPKFPRRGKRRSWIRTEVTSVLP